MLKLNPAGRQSIPSSEAAPISHYTRMAMERRDDAN
jgi:hypothetical protein